MIDFLLGIGSALLLFVLFFYYYHRNSTKRFDNLYKIAKTFEDRAKEEREKSRALELENLSLAKEKELKSNLEERFEEIANRVLDYSVDKGSKEMDSIALTLKDELKEFHRWIEGYYQNESNERFSLKNEIKNLQKLNNQLATEAKNLTTALKGDNKLQGDWGELVLKRVLESSGLKEGREYEVQKRFYDSNKRVFIPDVIVHLPQNRNIIIDSKVSLKSYEAYYNGNSEIGGYFSSIKRHIENLSKKSYHRLEGVNSLDFVLMFIPIEGAFSLLWESKIDIFEYAYKRDIIIVSPTTLMTVLRVIDNGWRFTNQNQNAKIITQKAGELYIKFSSFIQDMQSIETSLHKAVDNYESAFKKLSTGRGNMIKRASELSKLGGIKEDSKLKELSQNS